MAECRPGRTSSWRPWASKAIIDLKRAIGFTDSKFYGVNGGHMASGIKDLITAVSFMGLSCYGLKLNRPHDGHELSSEWKPT